MLNREVIAQIIGIFAMAMNVLSYQQKKQKTVIAFQLVGGALFAANFLMLGATVGGILNLVGVFRAIVFMNKDKFHSDKLAWQVGFVTIYLVSYVLTFTLFGKEANPVNFIIEFLPVVGMTATTISFRYKDAKMVRRFGLISSPSWLIYNIANGSVGAICCEVFSLISILIGIIRLDIKKNVVQKKIS